jgi:hypothetical protein
MDLWHAACRLMLHPLLVNVQLLTEGQCPGQKDHLAWLWLILPTICRLHHSQLGSVLYGIRHQSAAPVHFADGMHCKEYEFTDELTFLGCIKRRMKYKARVWWKPDGPVSNAADGRHARPCAAVGFCGLCSQSHWCSPALSQCPSALYLRFSVQQATEFVLQAGETNSRPPQAAVSTGALYMHMPCAGVHAVAGRCPGRQGPGAPPVDH